MIINLSPIWDSLLEYRDLGLAATALLLKGDLEMAEMILDQRAESFSRFQRVDQDLAHTDWQKVPEFVTLGDDIQIVDQKLRSALEQALEELSKDVSRFGEARRTLKGYRSGESGDTFFTRMA